MYNAALIQWYGEGDTVARSTNDTRALAEASYELSRVLLWQLVETLPAMIYCATPDGEPTRGGVPIADIFTGVYAVVGVLAALVERQKTGRGTLVDAALVDSQVGVLANQALNYLVSGNVPKRQGNSHPNIVPYQVFPVADGHIIIATGNDNQYQKLCGVLGASELAQKAEYLNNTGRLAHRDERIGQERLRLFGHDDLAALRPHRRVETDLRPEPGIADAGCEHDFFGTELAPRSGQHECAAARRDRRNRPVRSIEHAACRECRMQ